MQSKFMSVKCLPDGELPEDEREILRFVDCFSLQQKINMNP